MIEALEEKKEDLAIREYIDHYCPNPKILTQNEMKQIKYYYKYVTINAVEFNKKGHLIFRQRYPNFPIYLSCLSIVITLLVRFVFSSK